MMHRDYNGSVDLSVGTTSPKSLMDRRKIIPANLSTDPALSTDLMRTKETFQVKGGYKNGLVPLTTLELQILTEGIVLDQELISECRSGEI